MCKIITPIFLLTLVLSGCGGGGSGLVTHTTQSTVPFYTPQAINHYTPLATTTYTAPVIDLFTKDLNNDGSDEVVASAVAFGSQNTATGWKNANLQIYGFNTGVFKNETRTWFSGNDNQYLGGTTIRFGDFNGDGKVDMFAAAFSDNSITSSMPVFFNNGNNTFTRSNINFGDVGPHDSIVTDLNNDGYADIVVTDIVNVKPTVAFGSSTGNFSVYRSDLFGGGASISVADYLGNGTKTMIITDAPQGGSANQDTVLFSWNIENGKLILTKVADLPADRFTLSKWASVRSQTTLAPHAVRNITLDFNHDGRPDVIVFSTMPKGTNVHGYSEVQFLQNNGGGSFTDVTDTVLVNYNNNKTTSYNPQLIDVNNDGLTDILISATDYTGQSSTSVLLSTREGKFVESYTQVFDQFASQTNNMAGGGQQQPITIVQGPGGKRYLLTGVETTNNGYPEIAVYLSLIGAVGTTTAPATVEVLQQVWPWMSTAEANQVLARSISNWVDGMPVLDFDSIMNPIGPLMLSTNGRSGQKISITGSLRIPGLNPTLLNNIQAVDSLNRNFTINLTDTAVRPAEIPVQYSLYNTDVTQNWSGRFTNAENYSANGFSVSGNQSSYALSMTNHIGNDTSWSYRAGVAVVPNGNPWFGFNGMYGEIKQTTMFDVNATKFWSNGTFGQFGVIRSTVDFTPGLVKQITPMWLGYAVAGWKSEGLTLYGGIQPTAISGSASISLPTSVDSQGTMHYTQHNVKIQNSTVSFIGVDQNWNMGKHLFGIGMVVNSQRAYQAKASVKINF